MTAPDTGRPRDQELYEVLRRFNQTTTDYPRDQTVHALFSRQAAKTPDALAVIAGDRHLTYRELDEQSNRLARFLAARGLEPEAFVGVLLDRSPEAIVAILGILKAGGAYVPLNDELPFQRLKYMLQDTAARFLISEAKYIRSLNKLQWECPRLDVLLCLDSGDVHAAHEGVGEMMREEMWDYIRRDSFDDISGGGFRSSYTGEWLSREVVDGYADNICAKLSPYLNSRSRILEIGCASGISMFRLAPLVGAYHGTDMSPKILRWTQDEVDKKGLQNVRLDCLAAHEIDRLGERGYDVVILNSVVQCFSGHNYLRGVIRKAIDLLNDTGLIFLGNIWDQELQEGFAQSLLDFARQHTGKGYRTKIDRSEELFLARAFFEDLRHDLPHIVATEYSNMLGTVQSELSEYGYDVILRVDKSQGAAAGRPAKRHKHQCDRRALESLPASPLEAHGRPDSLAYLMYTSGTSGVPKGVMIEHRSVVRLVVNTNFCRLGATDRVLQAGPLAFDASTFEIWGALLNGGGVCLAPKEVLLDVTKLRQLIRRHGITTTFLTASLFNTLVDDDPEVFGGMKTVMVGGEKVSVRHVNRVRTVCPALMLINGYGPTENTTFTATYTFDELLTGDAPIGRPIANTTVYILGERRQPVAVGVSGELCAGGDGLARGYLNDPALTVEKFIPHPFAPGEQLYRTGDLARWRPDGNLEFLGRIDDQVKIRGHRIEPAEVERQLVQHEAVDAVVVLARDLGEDRQELLAYLTGRENVDVNGLREYLRRTLPDYMIPSYFIRLDVLPLNANGKVDRDALPAPHLIRPLPHGGHVPLQSETEERLASIWREVLGHQDIGATDNFFDLGGDSLKITKMAALVRRQMGKDMSLTITFRKPTLRELAEHIAGMTSSGKPTTP